MAIEERTGSDGKTRYLVRIESIDADGKRRRIRKGYFTNKKAAQDAETAAKYKRDHGTLIPPDRLTVADLLEQWLDVKESEVTPNTLADYRITVRKHIRPALGSIRVQNLRSDTIQRQYLTWSRKDADGKPMLSTYVIRMCHVCLRAAMDYAVRMAIIQTNPVINVRRPKNERRQFAWWNAQESKAFLAAVASYHDVWRNTEPPRRLVPAVLWDLLLREGMRRGEALGLRWRDINWEQGTAHIQQTVIHNKAAEGGANKIQAGAKTKHGERTVSLTRATIDHLKEWRKEWLREQVASSDWQDNDLIICTEDGRAMNPSNVTRSFNAICAYSEQQGTKLPRLKVHDLRHSCASMLLSSGVSAKVVSERLGHGSISITMDIYSHVLPHLQQSAADSMDRLLG